MRVSATIEVPMLVFVGGEEDGSPAYDDRGVTTEMEISGEVWVAGDLYDAKVDAKFSGTRGWSDSSLEDALIEQARREGL